MMVTFVSQCEKNALKKTRRVLDAFANRIGDNTWQTLITQDGLDTVQKMLRKTASRSTAVSCHWIRSRSRSQFLWVVGNKNKFNFEGYVPVNSTEQDLLTSDVENNWQYLPLIKALTGFAALIHDWGKASKLFQNKLNPEVMTKHKGDPLRHEWVSCILFSHLVFINNGEQEDSKWLKALIEAGIDEQQLTKSAANGSFLVEKLPIAAALIYWLVLSHHRLPLPKNKDALYEQRNFTNRSFNQLLTRVTSEWGYENRFDDFDKLKTQCFEFSNGLLSNSNVWLKRLQNRAQDLMTQLPQLEQAINDGSWQLVLHHSRLCLMLGDHYYSSQENDSNWQQQTSLFANTDRQTRALKQKLDEHLYYVEHYAVNAVKMLPFIESEPLCATNIDALKPSADTPKQFRWQDKAVNNIHIWRSNEQTDSTGCFIVNMASTGCGKTIANAKVMQALSDDKQSLRYVLALGLRTLTLQTGDEYKERLKLADSDLAVLIGSKSTYELHVSGKRVDKAEQESAFDDAGSESAELLQDENDQLIWDVTQDEQDSWQNLLPEEELSTVLTCEKDRKLLYAPVLTCTIDHIMAATETKRGGRYILPTLRLMSSDLVIDEIDDFSGDDFIAIGRLVRLAGMLGRKVMISSATIPPDLALGLFNAYRQGWALFAASRDCSDTVTSIFVDEFDTQIGFAASTQAGIAEYQNLQDNFLAARVGKLKKQAVKRKALIHPCDKTAEFSLEQQYFTHIQQAIINNHQLHHTQDQQTQKRVSFGVVRMANIAPCVALTKYLLSCDWPNDIDVRCMAYHSQQVMLLRHEQEKHLDGVLKRKEQLGQQPQAFENPTIREHLTASTKANVIFILVATPVEEVGRDHDFDWAVIEPSSQRSLIQMAGRVRRHREGEVDKPNIALMQYNLKGFLGSDKAVFVQPGYETNEFKLHSHDLTQLVDVKGLLKGVNAIARITKPEKVRCQHSLADLEHFITARTFGIEEIGKDASAAKPAVKKDRFARRKPAVKPIRWYEHLHGHISQLWQFTALPQTFKRFRNSAPSVQVTLVESRGRLRFCLRDDGGEFNSIEKTLGIEHYELTRDQQSRLWLKRDYSALLTQYATENTSEYITALKFGELSFTYYEGSESYRYNDQLGLVKV
ncbi:type I-F CRISPR-associated helicase Cas3 [Shewanella sp. WXL01]|uniref:type I-F CRISPR-associated helicase Cas3f n=1 Tax=Shewanella sp. WXL01 TaxID=2709721 RepID=UPI0014385D13|nr:type I-F CRISPR-associated helicase Cas3f [Shewanella sp. WXL01]NKF51193.1 type I-F CRISPR-associated helicase Cas3 [Shewanella sp. WXL01]